jgi:hypothetical protein
MVIENDVLSINCGFYEFPSKYLLNFESNYFLNGLFLKFLFT